MAGHNEFLLVDGYNIINAWPNLKEISRDSLEDARDNLIEILRDYQGYKGIKVIIVFDAHLIEGGTEVHEYYGDVEVVYTKEGEIADQYIERWVSQMGRDYKVRVATSDYMEQTIVLSRGGTRMSARELYLEVKAVREQRDKRYRYASKEDNNFLLDNVSEDVLEKLERMRRQR
ncbi:MAG TPA: NYN domain-containing protein [Clostridiales bacterium]|nr:NYN domain-containing protein [Clostridiales bacterium]